jgi:hypothetical protein
MMVRQAHHERDFWIPLILSPSKPAHPEPVEGPCGPDRAVAWHMPLSGRHWEWFISCAVFAGILIALVIAVLLQDPLGAGVP